MIKCSIFKFNRSILSDHGVDISWLSLLDDNMLKKIVLKIVGWRKILKMANSPRLVGKLVFLVF